MSDKNFKTEDLQETIVITQKPADDDASPADAGRTTERLENARSVFSGLGKRLFPGRLTVVDDTIGVSNAEEESGGAAKNPDIEKLTSVLEHYRIDPSPIAHGGQGVLSKATDLALGCEIAVKSLREKFCGDENARGSFLNEAKLTASLDHPAIIPIHGLFSDEKNGMHLAMKLIKGHTLAGYLKSVVTAYERGGVEKFDEHRSIINRIEIMLRVCDAVSYAHSRGIIHRDLKLENIMIGKHRETYVTDWGIAMNVKDAAHLKKITGTPGFIAPEVLMAHRADTRSDIYSLGVMLFELVTLTPAFDDKDLNVIIHRVKHGQPAPLRHRFGCRIDADLAAIIRKAMNFDPDQRYQTVDQFSEDLRRYLTHEETVANPDHLFAKFARWGVNHRRGMLITVMLAMLLGIGSSAYSLQKEIRGSMNRRYREHAVAAVYRETVNSANGIGRQMDKIESRLEQLRMNIFFSSMKIGKADEAAVGLFVPIETYRGEKPPATFVYSEAYGHPVDTDGVAVFNTAGGKVDMENLRYFGNTAACMREALLGEQEFGRNSRQMLLSSGGIVKKAYFSLADGTFACYPGSRDDFPPGYDPKTRVWYRQALEAPGRMIWSEPYVDSGVRRESVITCSIAIYGADGKFIGVAGMDFSLSKLAEQLFAPRHRYTRFTLETLLIDNAGTILYRMTPPENRWRGHVVDDETAKRILRRRHGTMIVETGGRELLMAFSYIDWIGLMYVECLDMGGLVDFQKSVTVEEKL